MRRARGGERLVVWPIRERGKLAATHRILLASGLAREPEVVADLGVDGAFAWSNAADRAGLVALARSTGAARVFLTGRCAEEAAQAIGPHARVLAPPRQMALFAEARG
jgi:hypothetical protein